MFDAALQGAGSAEFVGKAVVELAKDPKRLNKTGKILLTADLANQYRFTDQDGSYKQITWKIFDEDIFHGVFPPFIKKFRIFGIYCCLIFRKILTIQTLFLKILFISI